MVNIKFQKNFKFNFNNFHFTKKKFISNYIKYRINIRINKQMNLTLNKLINLCYIYFFFDNLNLN
jgi:hypothetical protein